MGKMAGRTYFVATTLPLLLGAGTWLVSAAAGIGALILADFGASPWAFLALAAWLLSLGLPTLLSTLLVAGAWASLPASLKPPPAVGLAVLAVASFGAQVGCALLFSRPIRLRRRELS